MSRTTARSPSGVVHVLRANGRARCGAFELLQIDLFEEWLTCRRCWRAVTRGPARRAGRCNDQRDHEGAILRCTLPRGHVGLAHFDAREGLQWLPDEQP